MTIPDSKKDLFAVQPTPDSGDLGPISESQQLEILLAEGNVKQQQVRSRYEVLQCIVCNKRIPKARREAIPGVQTCIKDQGRVDSGEISIEDYLSPGGK